MHGCWWLTKSDLKSVSKYYSEKELECIINFRDTKEFLPLDWERIVYCDNLALIDIINKFFIKQLKKFEKIDGLSPSFATIYTAFKAFSEVLTNIQPLLSHSVFSKYSEKALDFTKYIFYNLGSIMKNPNSLFVKLNELQFFKEDTIKELFLKDEGKEVFDEVILKVRNRTDNKEIEYIIYAIKPHINWYSFNSKKSERVTFQIDPSIYRLTNNKLDYWITLYTNKIEEIINQKDDKDKYKLLFIRKNHSSVGAISLMPHIVQKTGYYGYAVDVNFDFDILRCFSEIPLPNNNYILINDLHSEEIPILRDLFKKQFASEITDEIVIWNQKKQRDPVIHSLYEPINLFNKYNILFKMGDNAFGDIYYRKKTIKTKEELEDLLMKNKEDDFEFRRCPCFIRDINLKEPLYEQGMHGMIYETKRDELYLEEKCNKVLEENERQDIAG